MYTFCIIIEVLQSDNSSWRSQSDEKGLVNYWVLSCLCQVTQLDCQWHYVTQALYASQFPEGACLKNPLSCCVHKHALVLPLSQSEVAPISTIDKSTTLRWCNHWLVKKSRPLTRLFASWESGVWERDSPYQKGQLKIYTAFLASFPDAALLSNVIHVESLETRL